MITVTLWLPGQLPDLNEIIREARRNRFASARQKRSTEDRLRLLIRSQKPARLAAADVALGWVEPGKRRDPDNIRAGVKFVLDALVAEGVLPGDGWRHVHGLSDTYEVGPVPGVRVTLTGPPRND